MKHKGAKKKHELVARKHRRGNIDRRGRTLNRLEPEQEWGCQIYRKKILCAQPQFVVLGYADQKVGICYECWERLMGIAADAHVDTQEIRAKYEARAAKKNGTHG